MKMIVRNKVLSWVKNVRKFSISKESTIFSLSSGYGKCGVSVIRVSGPQTLKAMQALISDNFQPLPRYATLKSFRHPINEEIIDKGLVLWFPAPASFTGEDSCEFQCHGSVAVVAAMLDALGSVNDLRMAKPGEFTKRAFFNGKLDLTEVEGLADLIHAETEAQRKQALLQSTGSLSRLYGSWRQRLIKCAAHMTAYIDFSEDENIEVDVILKLTQELKSIQNEISSHLNDQRQGEMLRHGVRTAIVGAPNVGKSSFLNLICQRNVSIVTPIAGTTRDIIESPLNIGGYPVMLTDTAGLRNTTDDIVEQEGISRALDCILNADLILLMMDATQLLKENIVSQVQFELFVNNYFQQLGVSNKLNGGVTNMLVIANKIDLISENDLKRLRNMSNLLLISCQTETNLTEILDAFGKKLKDICGQPCAENPRLTQSRHRQQLNKCNDNIASFLSYYSPDAKRDLAIAAQKLQMAVKSIEYVTGNISNEEILDVVFRDFCIGK